MTKRAMNLPAGRLILGAIAAGALAGGVAVYAGGGLSGNTGAPSTAVADAAADAACTAKTDRAQAVADAATGEVAAMLPADPPRSLAGLAFDAPDRTPMVLGDLSGKTLLINLWATWCAPCRNEMPALDALQKQKGGADFEVVAVNVDKGDEEKPKAFLAEIGVSSLGFYRDETMKLFNDLKKQSLALGLPVTLLVDEEGCLLTHMNGPAEWAGEDAARLVDAARGG